MARRFFATALLFVVIAPAVFAQDMPKADGVELPPAQKVTIDEGLVEIQAKAVVAVTWDVFHLFGQQQAYKVYALPENRLLLAIPRQPGLIRVAAIVCKDGAISLASTIIEVTGSAPNPNPAPNPSPPGTGQVRFATILFDLESLTPAQAALRSSASLRTALEQRGITLRTLGSKQKAVSDLKLEPALKAGLPVLVLQSAKGDVLPGGRVFKLQIAEDAAQRATNEQQVLQAVDQANGQK